MINNPASNLLHQVKISSYPLAHMIAQVRIKQVATKLSQDKLQQQLSKLIEGKDLKAMTDELVSYLEKQSQIVKSFNSAAKELESPENELGFPILFNKTQPQLEMLLNRIAKQDSNWL